MLLHTVTMDAAQGVDFVRRTGPRRAVPVHHDDYRAFRSPVQDFLDAAERAGLRGIIPVRRGGTVDLTG